MKIKAARHWASGTIVQIGTQCRQTNTMALSPLFHKYSDVYFIGAIAPLWARLVSLEGAALPRSSPFVIRLSRGERQELQARTRKYTSPYRDVIRAKIVLLAAAGLSNDVIASRLDTPRQIVSKWRKRFALARLPGLQEQPRGGRPARFSPQRRHTGQSSRL